MATALGKNRTFAALRDVSGVAGILKFFSRGLSIAILFLLLSFASPAHADAFSVSNVSINTSTGAYSFDYSGYGGTGTSVDNVPVYNSNQSLTYAQDFDSGICTGTTSGTCSGTFPSVTNLPTCSANIYVSMYDGSHQDISGAVSSWCNPVVFYVSNVEVDTATGAYSFTYSNYTGGTGTSVANVQLYASNLSTSYAQDFDSGVCTGTTSGSCSGTFASASSLPTCGTNVHVSLYDGSVQKISGAVNPWCDPDTTFSVSSVSINKNTGMYSFNYSGYNGTGSSVENVPVYNSNQSTTYAQDLTNVTCTGIHTGSCSGSFSNVSNLPSCGTNIYVSMYDESVQAISGAVNPWCHFTVSNVSVNTSTGAYSFDYSLYNGTGTSVANVQLYASNLSTSYAQDFDSGVCTGTSSGTCSGTFSSITNLPSCGTDVYVSLYDGSVQEISAAVNPWCL